MGYICRFKQTTVDNRASVKIGIPPFERENLQVVVK